MTDDQMKIHLLIDNERYPLIIKREEEQLYRDAAKQIDYKLNKYRNKFPNFNTEKYHALSGKAETTGTRYRRVYR